MNAVHSHDFQKRAPTRAQIEYLNNTFFQLKKCGKSNPCDEPGAQAHSQEDICLHLNNDHPIHTRVTASGRIVSFTRCEDARCKLEPSPARLSGLLRVSPRYARHGRSSVKRRAERAGSSDTNQKTNPRPSRRFLSKQSPLQMSSVPPAILGLSARRHSARLTGFRYSFRNRKKTGPLPEAN